MKTVSNESLSALAEYSEKELGTRYVKPEFTDKFKHLSIQPSTTAMVVVAIITILITGGVCVFVVMNGIDNETSRRSKPEPTSSFTHPAVRRGSLKRTSKSTRRRTLK